MNTTIDRRRAFFQILTEAAPKGRAHGKYGRLEAWARTSLGVRSSAAGMGSLSKDFTKSVGQALAAMPEVIVLTSPHDFDTTTKGRAYVEKLVDVLGYASSLRAIVACHGSDENWRVEYLVGRAGSDTLALLQAIFPEAQVRTAPSIAA
jgi:hypothetical protein